MERPRPVPPYLRVVVPSACWNGSKMIASFSSEMPMPVSVTANATTCRAAASDGLSNPVLGGAGSWTLLVGLCVRQVFVLSHGLSAQGKLIGVVH